MSLGNVWQVTKGAVSEWSEDKASRLAAALALYTLLSVGPLLIIILKIVGKLFGEKAAQGQLFGYIHEMVGGEGAKAIEEIVKNANQPGAGVVATIISSIILLFTASGVFAELQDSMNTIWEVKPKPNRPWYAIIQERFFSMTLVLGVAFLLMVSLILSSVLSAVSGRLLGESGIFAIVGHFVISLAVITGLFALMFKYLPDVKIGWKPVWLGAAVTAVLFTIGKFLLGWYLGRASTVSVYGTFGSLVAFMLWVYYSAQIFFLGAEFTQVYAKQHGEGLEPSENAQKLEESERTQQGLKRTGRRQVAAQPPQTEPAGPRPLVVPNLRLIERPSGAKLPLTAGASLAAGLAVGALAAWERSRRQHLHHDLRRVQLDQRLEQLEGRMRRIDSFKKYAQDYDVSQRIGHAERKLDLVNDGMRRLERNPEVAPTLPDYARYVLGMKPRKAPLATRLARALHLSQ